MAKQITRWKPDTCSCVLDFSIEGEDVKGENVVFACEAHQGLDAQALYEQIKFENSSKNIAMETIVEAIKPVTDEPPQFTIDEERNVVIEVPEAAKSLVTELNDQTPENVIVQ